MYKSNAWELKQIPATCGHCSAGCQISYDVKHTSIENPEDKVNENDLNAQNAKKCDCCTIY